tara:strand:- start:423 stop:683 length:261 start_codon:yes stop_codon:yes gene_type:complete
LVITLDNLKDVVMISFFVIFIIFSLIWTLIFVVVYKRMANVISQLDKANEKVEDFRESLNAINKTISIVKSIFGTSNKEKKGKKKK